MLKRSLGLLDVVLFFVIAGSNLQWVATAAASGPGSIAVWIIGCLAMFVPLSIAVIHLSAIHPDEGGIYMWSKYAFGEFSGFMTGWTYWTTNFPYFAALLYFMAGNALFAAPNAHALRASVPFFVAVSLVALAFGTVVNIFGLDVEKWLNNIGAAARWAVTLILVAVGVYAWHRFGPATRITAPSLVPGFRVTDLIFWSTIAFAWVGPESISCIAGEIKNPRRSIPLGLAIAAPLIGGIYILGTMSVLASLKASTVDPLFGVMQTIQHVATLASWTIVTPVAAILVAISVLGSLAAWIGSLARLPFVAGIDAYLPRAFATMHPKYHSPVASLLTQALLAAIVIFVGQGGTSVSGAYAVLVGMTVLVTMVPFLFMFSAAMKIRGPVPPGSARIPGGHRTVVVASVVGLFTTGASMVLSVIPPASEPNKLLAVAKIVGLTAVLLGAGVVFYVIAGRRRVPSLAGDAPGRHSE